MARSSQSQWIITKYFHINRSFFPLQDREEIFQVIWCSRGDHQQGSGSDAYTETLINCESRYSADTFNDYSRAEVNIGF